MALAMGLKASLSGFADLFAPALRGLVLGSMALSAAILAAGVWAALHFGVPLIPDWAGGWGQAATLAASGAVLVLVIVAALVLFPIMAMIVSGVFVDVAADRLERALGKENAVGQPPSLATGLLAGLRFASVSIPLNLLALPLYFIPVVNLAVAIGLNAFLLSRENFMLASLRHGGWPSAKASLRRNRLAAFAAAILPACLVIVPFVNFVVPLWTLATMVRLRSGVAG
jgi:CysZ protein